MYTEDYFLEALREAPQDDDLRLIFSDWLEDQDDGRAAFLRIQVQRRRLAPDDPAQVELIHRQHELVRRGLANWLAPLAAYHVTLLRGNGLLGVVMTGCQFEELSPDDLAAPAWKWVDGLRLYDLANLELPELLNSSILDHFAHLDLSRNRLASGGLLALRGANLARLTTLDLEQTALGPEGCRILAEAPWLRQLRGLNLAGNPLGSVAFRELLVVGSLPELRVLELRSCGLGPIAIDSLVHSAVFAHLDALGLENNQLDNEGGLLLVRSPHLGRLKVLDLRGTNITGKSIRTLLTRRCPGLML